MTTYVIDCCSLNKWEHFPQQTFPSFWAKVDTLIAAQRLISVEEVSGEIQRAARLEQMIAWVKANRKMFLAPTTQEMLVVREILKEPHFQQLVEKRRLEGGGEAADPFLIASAKVRGAVLVTEEVFKKNGAKIPNVCQRYDVDCINAKQFYEREAWTF